MTYYMMFAWASVIFGFSALIMVCAKPERTDRVVEILVSCCAACLVPPVIALGASL